MNSKKNYTKLSKNIFRVLHCGKQEKESAALDFRKALSLGYDTATIENLLKQTY
jgi:hypothetical protein